MRIFLVKHGIPFDVAFAANDEWALASYVVLAELEGNRFNWDRMEFEDRR